MTIVEPPKPPKLHMIWPRMRRPRVVVPHVPSGYTLRMYRSGDEHAYVELMRKSGFETWNMERARRVFATMLADGLFFAVHDATGGLAATTAAQNMPTERYPDGAELGWVGADPAHRGQGLGTLVCAAATNRLLRSPHPILYLQTDDFRLPAIHVYLKLGWVPFLYTPEVVGVWRTVCRGLGIPYESIETTHNPTG
jgi:mycothiol synthase